MKRKAIRFAGAALCVVLGAATLTAPAQAAPTTAAATTALNIIRNPGAEHTTGRPNSGGTKVGLTSWSVAKRYDFTAVRYGTPTFVAARAVGPKLRGRNFFAGGTDGTMSIATQTDSLADDRLLIKAGQARFSLSGWLGGYSSQNDHAVVTATWKNKSGKAVGTAAIGPVNASSRRDATSLRFRATTGQVPKSATQVLVTITMTRAEGGYNDGYADNLKLILSMS